MVRKPNYKTALVVLCLLLVGGIIFQFLYFPKEVVVEKNVTQTVVVEKIVEKPVEVIKYVDRNITQRVIEYQKYCPPVDHPSPTAGEIEKWINKTDSTYHNQPSECAKQGNISLCDRRNNFLEQ